MDKIDNHRRPGSGEVAMLIYLAAATIVIHLLVGGRYGFHRDELATLDDARHLAWGYVAYPPVTPFFARLSLQLFGTSLAGFRFFAALACATAVLFTGLMARELGGRRSAQLLAAFAALPFTLAAGSLMQYVSFDYLAWVVTAYFSLRLLKSEDPRWWLGIGAAIGLGMLTKYSMLVCVAGLTIGVLLTKCRRHLQSKWLWIGVAVSLSIFLPNFIWQWRHDFVSLDFLRDIHERDMRIGRTKDFLPDQLLVTLFALPLAIIGLCFFFVSRNTRDVRALGWMYVIPFLIFLTAKGRGYYLAPAYPVLYAGGSVWTEQWLGNLRPVWSRTLRVLAWFALSANVALVSAFFLPLAPINSQWWKSLLKVNSDLREEFGWPELVETVAHVRDSLPPIDRARLAILTGNYGEAGAINLYGPAYGLPPAISGINSFWERGYGDPPPETLIVVGLSREFLERNFEYCESAAHISNRYGVENEEATDNSEIFICRRLRRSWPEFWKERRHYG